MCIELRINTEIVKIWVLNCTKVRKTIFFGNFAVKFVPVFGWFRSVVSAKIVKKWVLNCVKVRKSLKKWVLICINVRKM